MLLFNYTKIVDGKYIQFTKKIMYNYGVVFTIKSSTHNENHSPIHIHCNSNNNVRSLLFWSCLHIYIVHSNDNTVLACGSNITWDFDFEFFDGFQRR